MKYIFLIIFLLSVGFQSSGQDKQLSYQVTGQIVEKVTGKGVAYATVIIQNDSIKEKKAQACDPSGRFSFIVSRPVSYTLVATAVGYKEIRRQVLISAPKTDAGKLEMEEGIELKEVTITAQKPLVKVDPDKIVYSMESDPEAQANNALEMLRKVPLINVDAEDNITLNGQSNFKVLVNGKTSTMISSNFKEAMKSMPASTIKDIQVITNPGTKYDAEGVGGIINIITTRKTMGGYNGSVGGGIDARGSFNGNAYVAAKVKKFSFSTRYYVSQFQQPGSQTEGSSEYFNNSDFHFSNSDGTGKYNGYGSSLTGEASLEIDSLNLISMSVWGYNGSYENNGFSKTQFLSSDEIVTRLYNNTIKSKSGYGSLSGNIDYQKTYKKPEKSLTFSYKLENNPHTSRNLTDVEGITAYPSYHQQSNNKADGREQTFQADYYDPLTDKHQIECGLKFILRQNKSNSEIYRDEVKVENVNDLDYDQYIFGAYAGYVFKLKKMSTKAGLRLERTWNDGVSKTAGENTYFTNRLINFIPYITFSYMPKEGQTVKLSYTQRLSRPGIWYLNPYVDNTDSLNISYGNPRLEAEISHSFELGYTYFKPKFNLSVSLNSSFVNNSIENITKVEETGARVTTYENIGKDQHYGINVYFSWRPNAKVNIYLNGGGSYANIEASSGYAISNSGFSYRGFVGGRFTLWKDGSLNTYLGAYSPDIMLQGRSASFYYTGLGISQYFLKRKLMLNLSTSDPFWHRKQYTYESGDITFNSKTKYSYVSQNVRISITYNFGKMQTQVKKANRGINNDDVKAGGGSQGGGNSQQQQ